MDKLRNIAIIAHVDHGKTTLVDEMLKQGGVYRENQEIVDRVMDSNDLERERGITILAKNTAVRYGDTKINIVDTPGHADFGGEVERVLKMVNGVILLVDAAEGPMPQTRFVLGKALELGHRVIVVVNKIDRPDQRIYEVVDEVLELLMDLDATDEQLDSPMLFCSGRNGTASLSPEVPGTDLKPLFDTILDYIPAPDMDTEAPFQMLVSSIDYNEFVGRIAIGRIERGTVKQNQEIAVCNYHAPDAAPKKAKAVSMYQFEGLNRVPVQEATAGNIIAMSGIGDITIGDTICAPDCVEPIEFVKISAPTLEMTFSVNDGPFAGREGKYVTSRQIRDRLMRETLKDVSLRVSEIENATDSFNVAGSDDRRRAVRTDGAPRRRRADRGLRRRDRKDLLPQGRDAGDAPDRQAHKTRVHRAEPRTLRLPQRVPHRHEGRGHHGERVRLLCPVQGRAAAPRHRLPRRLRDGRERDLRPLQCAGARPALHRAGRAGV